MTASSFSAVHTEGGLLPPDLLERIRVLDADLPGLRPEDYGLAPAERLSDAIVRSWTRLNGLWQSFADKLDHAPTSETTFESQTRKLWQTPLLQELGFGQLTAAAPVVFDVTDNKAYPVSHHASDMAVHLVGARVDLDRRPRPGVRPAHGMVQEFLNRSGEHLWALTTNGLRLRLLRDSSSLTRQAYCEFDLEAMFRGQQYADFALCWLVCHATRFAGDPPASCYLERWSNQAQTDGTRALDQLRGGVESAIVALGTGFLADPANGALRQRLRDGDLAVADYHRQLLRLVYRLIFLLVAEARDLLHAPGADPVAVERYRRWYSLHRIADLSRTRRGTTHGDLWEGLRVVFDALAAPGLPSLALTGLGSYLWSPSALTDLGPAALSNRALLDAMHYLTTVTESTGRRAGRVRRAVDYRNLGAEELGSVYESLLELHPVIDGRDFRLGTAAGNERKTTGSYYTPTPLIRVLLDSALDPVIEEATAANDPDAALLDLKVLDSSVGSGHFLIAAAHRIAHRLASIRSGESEPSPEELRSVLREVIANCVYGIDVNPMAVELCKVSLWMEATEPGKPLGFLEHHIVCGNSLLGATPALLADGLPDDAFKPLEGDDKAWVSTLKKRNKSERTQRDQGAFDFGADTSADVTALAAALAELDAMPEGSAEAIAAKEARYAELVASAKTARARLAADAWCAAFVAPKTPDAPILTDATVGLCARHPEKVPAEVRDVVDAMVEQYRFLHLHVAFPTVFTLPEGDSTPSNPLCGWSGGFDVVLGNPPWERVKLQEKEFFAAKDPEIAAAPNAAARKRLIAALERDNPELHDAFTAASRHAMGESHLMRDSGRYPLGGRGDVNTYAVFAELMSNAMSPTGRVGVVVPTGIATDDTTKHFFADLVDRRSLASLYDFENRLKVFPAVDSRMKFCLLTLSGSDRPIDAAEFVFFALDVADLDDEEKRFTLAPEDFELLNPHTRSAPIFRTRRDVRVAKAVASRLSPLVPLALSDAGWQFRYKEVIHLSHDAESFVAADEADPLRHVPVVEAKTCWYFDHRAADVVLSKTAVTRQGQSQALSVEDHEDPSRLASQRYWVDRALVEQKLRGEWNRPWMLGFRDITSTTNERTMVATVVPFVGLANTIPLGIVGSHEAPLLAAVLSSFMADWCCRQRLAGLHLTMNVLRNVTVPPPSLLQVSPPFAAAPVSEWMRPRVLELTFTAWDLAGFAADLGHHGPPFRWDEDRRPLLRAELDALMFRLYGIERDDVDYILDTFPIVKRKDEAACGEFRTKRLILERFDAMAEAEAAGVEYQTALDPPPADPSLCHPESTRPDWAKD